jgi:hypothetical protein
VLVGEIAGTPAAAISLGDDRAIADPFIPTAHLLATLRAQALRVVDRTPSLRERLIAGPPSAANCGFTPPSCASRADYPLI